MKYIRQRQKSKGGLPMLISDKLQIKTKITVIKKWYSILINYTICRENKVLMMFTFMIFKYFK